MKPRQRIHELDVTQPCHVPWDSMNGDEKTRFCEDCNRQVHKFSEINEDEIVERIRESDGSLCAQIQRTSDGKIVTKKEPTKLRGLQFSLFSLVALVTAVAGVFGFSRSLNVPEDADSIECEPLGGVVIIPADFVVDDMTGEPADVP